MGIAFSKHDIFPFIGNIIDDELQLSSSINRDEIAQKLLKSSVTQEILNYAVTKYKTDDLLKVAGNMIDWFSAEITKQSNVAIPWVNKYVRKRIKVKGRKIWEYALADDILPNEITEDSDYSLIEGATKKVTTNAYERNPKARTECIKLYGVSCICCGFNFQEKYGNIGKDFIHVHHIRLLSEIKKEYMVNPKDDLRPVCPNCHAMIHRKNPPFTIEEIKKMIV